MEPAGIAAEAQREEDRRDEEMSDAEMQERRILIECASMLMTGKDRDQHYRQLTADLRKQSQDTRAEIRRVMAEAGQATCMKLSGTKKYIRLNESSSVGTITVEVVKAAIDALTIEDLRLSMEATIAKESRKRVADRAEVTPFDGLINAIYDKIRNNRKKGNVLVKLADSLPRGVAEEDVPAAPPALQQLCDRLEAVQADLKRIAGDRKAEEEERKEKLESLEEEAQQILMDRGQPEEDVETTTRGNFKLRCKRTERLPPIKLKSLREEVLPKALEAVRGLCQDLQSTHAVLRDAGRAAEILAQIKACFDRRQPVVSTKLSLDKVGSRFVGVGGD